MTPTRDQVRRAPKVLLHDHLDGGLRPATIVELAARDRLRAAHHETPAELGAWFAAAADSGSLERYLETFAHTVGVMQTDAGADPGRPRVRRGPRRRRRRLRRGPLRARAARRARADASTRSSRRCRPGSTRAAPRPRGRAPDPVGALLTAMRHQARSMEIAELAIACRDRGRGRLRHRRRRGGLPADPAPGRVRVPAAGERPLHHPRRRGASGCRRSGRRSSGAAPTGSVTACGSSTTSPCPTTAGRARAGSRRTCGTSGSRSRCARPPTCRPARPRRSPSTRSGCCSSLRFRVTVNTDNRLMSRTSMTHEMPPLVDAFGYGLRRPRSGSRSTR